MNIYFYREIEHFGTVKDRGTAMKINEFARKKQLHKPQISTWPMVGQRECPTTIE